MKDKDASGGAAVPPDSDFRYAKMGSIQPAISVLWKLG
jgi:hypothetical protein